MANLSLAEIEAQIKEREDQVAQLRAAAAKQRKEELGEVVRDLRRKIAKYGISARELGFSGKAMSRRRVDALAKGPTHLGANGATEGLAQGETPADLPM